MNENKRRLRTGIFLVASLLVVLAILFFLGGRDLFSKKIRVCTYFDESVQGLNRGAAVKFKGATVGTVSDIRIIFPSYVLVEMELDVSRFTAARGDFERAFLREVREKGLCCRLEYVGITGLKFVDFDYHHKHNPEARKNPKLPTFIAETDAIYVPSVNSSFTDISTSVAGAIDKLKDLDLKKINDEMTGTLQSLRTLLSNQDLTSTISHLNKVAGNIEKTISEKRINSLVGGLEENLSGLRRLIKHMDDAAAGANIPESASAFRSAAAKVTASAGAMQDAAGAVVTGQQELSNTLLKLNQTIDSLRMLIEYIESDPGALLRGKARQDEKK